MSRCSPATKFGKAGCDAGLVVGVRFRGGMSVMTCHWLRQIPRANCSPVVRVPASCGPSRIVRSRRSLVLIGEPSQRER